ncbi:tyrosine-type recombinase/integrase [Salidesulfovibrio brasiliensis]|uniref:tyrosine-type recombinase/integrase n=1 Tax=Salidesulfovibrio brasiliensis TaxID=221711 RepID=UPI0006D0DAE7|nr:tyrosine-type recombinase/integrase [Salidesulfovibrio brasiliensis]
MIGCRPFSDAEVVSLFEGFAGPFEYRDRCLLILGLRSGPRVSEMLRLKVRDVVINNRVRRFVSLKQTKTDETREIELDRDEQTAVFAAIKALHLSGCWSPDTYLFRSREGGNRPISRSRAWQIIHGTARRLGLDGKIGTHSMRKTFANNMYEELERLRMAGEHVDPLIETARAGGWKSLEGLRNYLDFRREHIRQAKRALSGRHGRIPCPC